MNSIYFSKSDWKFCNESLKKVSRSFALSIMVLEGDLRKCITIGYLLCRIIDTIEDCTVSTVEFKQEWLRKFPSFLQDPSMTNVHNWIIESMKI